MNRIFLAESGRYAKICALCDTKTAIHDIRCINRPEDLGIIPICGICENRLYDLLYVLINYGQEGLNQMLAGEEEQP